MTKPPSPRPERPHVLMAPSPAGYDLPVIDVTNPAFALEDTPEAVAALAASFRQMQRPQRHIPKFLMRFLMRRAARESQLLTSLMQTETTYLSGLSTYAMKLGPDNLVPPIDSAMDRRMASAASLTSMRLRLQQLAQLMAEELEPELSAKPGRPLHLVNIGGGPAIDSLNTLIILRKNVPGLLNRPIFIHVLDRDEAGPEFGVNALRALQADGEPLAGLDITFSHLPYDWSDPAPLGELMDRVGAESALIAASSEGALFDYGTDDAVRANLSALYHRGNGARLVAASATRTDEPTQAMLATSPFALMPRGTDGMKRLAEGTGYAIVRSTEALISDQLILKAECPTSRH